MRFTSLEMWFLDLLFEIFSLSLSEFSASVCWAILSVYFPGHGFVGILFGFQMELFSTFYL